MLRVIIVCSWGMSTSLLVDSMQSAADRVHITLAVEALSAGEFAARVDECDVVLIAPQIRHLRKSIEKLALSLGKPVALDRAVSLRNHEWKSCAGAGASPASQRAGRDSVRHERDD